MPRFNVLVRAVLASLVLGLAHAEATPLFDQMKAQYRTDFGIELVAEREVYPLAGLGERIEAKNTGEGNADMVLYFLRKEFAKYPRELVRRSGLKRIILCRDLKAGPIRIAGVAVARTASIYVDSTTEVGDEAHRRRTLHHELFHIIDYSLRDELFFHPDWEEANAPGVTYGSPPQRKTNQQNWASHPADGFLSDYSMSALPEDRAELFAGLMTNNLTLRLLVQRDPYLANKVRILKEELGGFCPEVNAAFWAERAKL